MAGWDGIVMVTVENGDFNSALVLDGLVGSF